MAHRLLSEILRCRYSFQYYPIQPAPHQYIFKESFHLQAEFDDPFFVTHLVTHLLDSIGCEPPPLSDMKRSQHEATIEHLMLANIASITHISELVRLVSDSTFQQWYSARRQALRPQSTGVDAFFHLEEQTHIAIDRAAALARHLPHVELARITPKESLTLMKRLIEYCQNHRDLPFKTSRPSGDEIYLENELYPVARVGNGLSVIPVPFDGTTYTELLENIVVEAEALLVNGEAPSIRQVLDGFSDEATRAFEVISHFTGPLQPDWHNTSLFSLSLPHVTFILVDLIYKALRAALVMHALVLIWKKHTQDNKVVVE